MSRIPFHTGVVLHWGWGRTSVDSVTLRNFHAASQKPCDARISSRSFSLFLNKKSAAIRNVWKRMEFIRTGFRSCRIVNDTAGSQSSPGNRVYSGALRPPVIRITDSIDVHGLYIISLPWPRTSTLTPVETRQRSPSSPGSRPKPYRNYPASSHEFVF